MTQETEPIESGAGKPSFVNYLYATAAVFIVIAGLKAASSIVVPILLAMFLAIVLAAPLNWLVQRGVRTIWAIVAIAVVIILAALLIVMIIGSSMQEFYGQLDHLQRQLSERTDELQGRMDDWGVEPWDEEGAGPASPMTVMSFTKVIVNELANLLKNSFIVVVAVVFLLLESSQLPKKLGTVLPPGAGPSFDHIETILANVRRYLAIKTFTSFITGVLVVVLVATFAGWRYALLWGLIAFLFNYVPFIGSIIAAIPPVLLAIIAGDLGAALALGIGYLVINTFVSNVIEPVFMGQGLGLSPLVVFLSLLFWGWVLGPVGMLLSAPLTMAVKIVLAEYEDTQSIAILMSAKPPAEEEEE